MQDIELVKEENGVGKTSAFTPQGGSFSTWTDDSDPLTRLRWSPGTLTTAELMALLFSAGTDVVEERAYAEELLRSYQDLGGMLQAEFDHLCYQQNLGLERTIRLRASLELARRMGQPQRQQQIRLHGPEDAARLLLPQLRYLPREQMRVLLLNETNDLVGNVMLYQGTLETISTRVAEIYQPALLRGCPRIVLAHLHPSGSSEASEADLAITRQLVKAGDLLDIQLIDHLLVTNEGFVSLLASLTSEELGITEKAS